MSKTFRSLSVVLFAAMIAAFAAPMLRAADAPTGAKGSIKGTVTDADHKALSGVPVRLFAASDAPTTRRSPAKADPATVAPSRLDDTPTKKKPTPLMETTTDANGAYTFADVPAGEYSVFAGSKEVGHTHAKVKVTAGAPTTLDLTVKQKKPAA